MERSLIDELEGPTLSKDSCQLIGGKWLAESEEGRTPPSTTAVGKGFLGSDMEKKIQVEVSSA